MAKKNYYAVARGYKPGIYRTWYGEEGAEVQVNGYQGALYKGFVTLQEAQQWLEQQSQEIQSFKPTVPRHSQKDNHLSDPSDAADTVVIYTDGACLGNPGRGGYAAIILEDGQRKEIAGGFTYTTNNRMELIACITALELLTAPRRVILYSDSSYVVNGINLGWARKWRSRGWRKADGKPAENHDLWDKLLKLTEKHRVEFRWLRGHDGHLENERCDQLAVQAAQQPALPPDHGYISNHQLTSL